METISSLIYIHDMHIRSILLQSIIYEDGATHFGNIKHFDASGQFGI